MAILVNESGGNFSTATWYRAEAHNLYTEASGSLAAEVYSITTFANAGNLKGVVSALGWLSQSTAVNTRSVAISIEKAATVTMPVASPGVVTQTGHGFTGPKLGVTFTLGVDTVCTYAGHGLHNYDRVMFTSTSGLPTGVYTSILYYVRNATANTFQISTTHTGALIETTGAGTGSHYFWNEFVRFTTTGVLPTGVTANTVYVVRYIDANTYNVSTTGAAALINFTGSPSGTHTAWNPKERLLLSPDDIWGTGQLNGVASCYFVPAYFSGDTAVTTTASGWRFTWVPVDGAGTAHSIYMNTAATTVFHLAWCDNAISWSSGDNPVITKPMTYDVSTAFTGNVRFYSYATTIVSAMAGLICTPDKDHRDYGQNGMFNWDGSASRTLSINGNMFVGTQAGVYIGTEAAPISYANKAVITIYQPTFAGATALIGGFNGISFTSNYYGGGQTFCFSGEVPAQRYATLTADTAVGSPVLTVDDASGFQTGDYVYITKNDAAYSSANNAAIYQVLSTGTGTITLSTNIAGQKRLAGGFVMLTERGYGVQFLSGTTGSNSYVSWIRQHGIANLYMKGVWCRGMYGILGYSTNYRFTDNVSRLRQWWVENCFFENYQNVQGSLYGMTYIFANELGAVFTNNLGYGATPIGNVGQYTLKFTGPTRVVKCGVTYYEENIVARSGGYSFLGNGGGLPGTVYTGNIAHNMAIQSYGQNNIYNGNYTYGTSWAFYWNIAFGARLNNETAERMITLWGNGGVATNLIDVVDTNTTVIGTVPGTTLSPLADSYYDYTFVNPSFDCTAYNAADQTAWLPGSKIKVVDNAATPNNDFVITPTGKFQRCGNLLADSTAYGSNLYSWRFEPGTPPDALEYSYNQVIGDQTGQDMFVYVWLKINSANYWSGTHQLPRLYVTYDNGAVVYAQAAESTNWQQLIAPFQPTTDYSAITVAINGITDQSGTDAHFYLGHIGTVLPEGRSVAPGTLNFWSEAEPLTGISSGLSAFDVWSIPTSQLTGAGTIGKKASKALTLPQFMGLK